MNFRPDAVGKDEPRIDIAPLIDVVFLLLIFFLLTTTFVSHRALNVELPGSRGAAERSETDTLALALTPEGEVLHAGAVLEPDALRSLLAEAGARPETPRLLLQADREVPHGRVVEVMDLARRSGLRKVAIATRAESGSPQ